MRSMSASRVTVIDYQRGGQHRALHQLLNQKCAERLRRLPFSSRREPNTRQRGSQDRYVIGYAIRFGSGAQTIGKPLPRP